MDMALCNSCGENILEDGDFCQHCGTSSGVEPAKSKYKPSTIDRAVIRIVVICGLLPVLWVLLVAYSHYTEYYFRGGIELRNNTIAHMHGLHLLNCFEIHYADYQRYPLSIDHLQRECYDYLDKNGVINDLLKKKVILNVTLLNEEDYEFIIFHTKGDREWKMNSSFPYIRYREKGEKEWRKH